MSYFLYSGKFNQNQALTMDDDEVAHFLARRIKSGELVAVQDESGVRMECLVVKVTKKEVVIRPRKTILTPPEPKEKIVLYQSYVNEQALDFILQKSTELGAGKLVLFNSDRTAAKVSSDRFKQKAGRWGKIMWEAAKQSGRLNPPALEHLEGLGEVLRSAQSLDKLLVFDISGKPLKSVVSHYLPTINSLGIVIGPEGGLSQAEIDSFKNLPNGELVNLGPILLRAETAALSALATVRNLL